MSSEIAILKQPPFSGQKHTSKRHVKVHLVTHQAALSLVPPTWRRLIGWRVEGGHDSLVDRRHVSMNTTFTSVLYVVCDYHHLLSSVSLMCLILQTQTQIVRSMSADTRGRVHPGVGCTQGQGSARGRVDGTSVADS